MAKARTMSVQADDDLPVTDTSTENPVTDTSTENPVTNTNTAMPVLNTLQEKVDKYFEFTGLKLDYNCHMDMEFVEMWYQNKYLTKVVYKWAMKPGARIVHYVDGVIYKAANMTDEIAERLMKENPAYAEQFISLIKEEV